MKNIKTKNNGIVSCLWCLVFAIGIFSVSLPHAQTDAGEYDVKAAFLYKFRTYVEWPESAFADADSPLVIGVAGSNELVWGIERIVESLSLGNRQVEVRPIGRYSSIAGLHLLFISRNAQRRMPHLMEQAQQYSVLLVTESPGGLKAGSVINFLVQDNRVRFDISQVNARQQGLKLSAQLLKVARDVRQSEPP